MFEQCKLNYGMSNLVKIFMHYIYLVSMLEQVLVTGYDFIEFVAPYRLGLLNNPFENFSGYSEY